MSLRPRDDRKPSAARGVPIGVPVPPPPSTNRLSAVLAAGVKGVAPSPQDGTPVGVPTEYAKELAKAIFYQDVDKVERLLEDGADLTSLGSSAQWAMQSLTMISPPDWNVDIVNTLGVSLSTFEHNRAKAKQIIDLMVASRHTRISGNTIDWNRVQLKLTWIGYIGVDMQDPTPDRSATLDERWKSTGYGRLHGNLTDKQLEELVDFDVLDHLLKADLVISAFIGPERLKNQLAGFLAPIVQGRSNYYSSGSEWPISPSTSQLRDKILPILSSLEGHVTKKGTIHIANLMKPDIDPGKSSAAFAKMTGIPDAARKRGDYYVLRSDGSDGFAKETFFTQTHKDNYALVEAWARAKT